MTERTLAARVALLTLLGVLCFAPESRHHRVEAAGAPILGILQSEMRRNFDVLRKEATPAYFVGYTVSDERSTQISASLGALDGSSESHGRYATVEVRVGDYV